MQKSIAVIGGGLSGVSAAVEALRQVKSGRFSSVTVFERGLSFGGLWKRLDTASPWPNFRANLSTFSSTICGVPHTSSSLFPTAADHAAYIDHVASTHGVHQVTSFRSTVRYVAPLRYVSPNGAASGPLSNPFLLASPPHTIPASTCEDLLPSSVETALRDRHLCPIPSADLEAFSDRNTASSEVGDVLSPAGWVVGVSSSSPADFAHADTTVEGRTCADDDVWKWYAFTHVVLATGFNSRPAIPHSLSMVKGCVVHSEEVGPTGIVDWFAGGLPKGRGAEGGRRGVVCVVGGGHSAVEVLAALAEGREKIEGGADGAEGEGVKDEGMGGEDVAHNGICDTLGGPAVIDPSLHRKSCDGSADIISVLPCRGIYLLPRMVRVVDDFHTHHSALEAKLRASGGPRLKLDDAGGVCTNGSGSSRHAVTADMTLPIDVYLYHKGRYASATSAAEGGGLSFRVEGTVDDHTRTFSSASPTAAAMSLPSGFEGVHSMLRSISVGCLGQPDVRRPPSVAIVDGVAAQRLLRWAATGRLRVMPSSRVVEGIAVAGDKGDVSGSTGSPPHSICSDSLSQMQASLSLSCGGTVVADRVVAATGYSTHLPTLPRPLRDILKFQADDPFVPLPLCGAFLRGIAPTSLVAVGLYKGPYFGVCDVLARVAVRTMASQLLPPRPSEVGAAVERALKWRSVERSARPQLPSLYKDDLSSAVKALGGGVDSFLRNIPDDAFTVTPKAFRDGLTDSTVTVDEACNAQSLAPSKGLTSLIEACVRYGPTIGLSTHVDPTDGLKMGATRTSLGDAVRLAFGSGIEVQRGGGSSGESPTHGSGTLPLMYHGLMVHSGATSRAAPTGGERPALAVLPASGVAHPCAVLRSLVGEWSLYRIIQPLINEAVAPSDGAPSGGSRDAVLDPTLASVRATLRIADSVVRTLSSESVSPSSSLSVESILLAARGSASFNGVDGLAGGVARAVDLIGRSLSSLSYRERGEMVDLTQCNADQQQPRRGARPTFSAHYRWRVDAHGHRVAVDRVDIDKYIPMHSLPFRAVAIDAAELLWLCGEAVEGEVSPHRGPLPPASPRLRWLDGSEVGVVDPTSSTSPPTPTIACAVVARDHHLCGEDHYLGTYVVAPSGAVVLRYDVVGPHKSYTSTTVLTRREPRYTATAQLWATAIANALVPPSSTSTPSATRELPPTAAKRLETLASLHDDTHPLDLLSPLVIGAPPFSPAFTLCVVPHIRTTMQFVRDVLRVVPPSPSASSVPPFAMHAVSQASARGSGQRSWAGALVGNVHVSYVIPFHLLRGQTEQKGSSRSGFPPLLAYLPLLVACAIRSAVAAAVAETVEVGLKWPNDVIVRCSAGGPWLKVAGCIIETTRVAGIDYAVVGVGVNTSAAPYVPPSVDGSKADATARFVNVERGRGAAHLGLGSSLKTTLGFLGSLGERIFNRLGLGCGSSDDAVSPDVLGQRVIEEWRKVAAWDVRLYTRDEKVPVEVVPLSLRDDGSLVVKEVRGEGKERVLMSEYLD